MVVQTIKSLFFIPRQDDGKTYLGVSPGSQSFVSTNATPLYSGYRYLPPFPPDAPQQLYLVRARARVGLAYFFDGRNSGGAFSQFTAWVDPGGVAYQSAAGAEAGSDFSRDITLFQLYFYPTVTQAEGVAFPQTDETFPAPILCDRSAGDLIVMQWAGNAWPSWLYMELGYLA